MGKAPKTQWDFGDLFAGQASEPAEPQPVAPKPAEHPAERPRPAAQTRKILSVSELSSQIRRLLEGTLGMVWVTGEITNLKVQGSGHIYFTLKDAGAQISCVLFRGEYQVNRSLLQDGRKVTIRGEVTVYEPRGQCQLRVTGVELQGLGALQEAFEKLKQKLSAEGLFAKERKRPLPKYPQRIGLVTSATGAAIRDVVHVIERRNPGLEIILVPCRVQGEGAGMEIARAIRLLNEFHVQGGGQKPTSAVKSTSEVGKSKFQSQDASSPQPSPPKEERGKAMSGLPGVLDLILVTRGGGSLEDLWAFNEEVVARAIFHSQLAVVSGVGHEIDFTICDFVADVRAATPSAAAEIITEGVFSSGQFVTESERRILQLARQRIADKKYELGQTGQRLGRLHPRRRFNEWLQRLDDLQGSLARCAKQGLRHQRVSWRNLAERLSRVRPALLLRQRRELLRQEEQRLREQAHHSLERRKNRFAALESKLHLLGPEQVLARGYSITLDAESGKVLRDAAEARVGSRLRTKLKAGEIISKVEKAGKPKPDTDQHR
jgi:exodeoxyribonuclease VII large subunit